jgi:Copper transport outer membrane protein, MctB
MFDFRYHALSLAAVLLALALGVVIGVAIGDSSLVSSAKSGIVHELSSEVGEAQHQADQLRARLGSEEAFANGLYPIAVHEQLGGRSIGLLFLGSSSDQVNALVRDAVAQAGGNLVMVVAVREPLDLVGIAREAAGTRFAALGATSRTGAEGAARGSTGATQPARNASGATGAEGGTALTERFGVVVGRQLVSGGANAGRELVSRVGSGLLSAFDGQLTRLEGLVVERADPAGMSAEQAQASSAFDSGLIAGVAAARVTAVGVELSSTRPSQVPWYQSKGISSVDDLDMTAGQAALAYALGGSRGVFGTKSTAESLLPNVAGSSTQP